MRSDQRAANQLRDTTITPDYLMHAEGSVLICAGNTRVICTASVGIVDGEPLLDLAYDDDSRAEVDMNIVKTGDGRFIEVQGTAEAIPFGREALDTLLDLADHGIRQLVDKQKAIVGHLVKQTS